MPIKLNDNIRLKKGAILDERYGPWSSTTAALNNIPSSYRAVGLTVGIFNADDDVDEYWFLNETDLENAYLTLKQSGSGGNLELTGGLDKPGAFDPTLTTGDANYVELRDGIAPAEGATPPNPTTNLYLAKTAGTYDVSSAQDNSRTYSLGIGDMLVYTDAGEWVRFDSSTVSTLDWTNITNMPEIFGKGAGGTTRPTINDVLESLSGSRTLSVVLSEMDTFDGSLNAGVQVPNDVGGVAAGTTFGDLVGDSHSTVLMKILFPNKQPTVNSQPRAGLSISPLGAMEVGKTRTITLSANLNQGRILNGDGSTVPLVGGPTSYDFSGPDGYTHTTNQNGDSVTFIPQTDGNYNWTVVINHSEGTLSYFDAYGNDVTDASIDGQRVPGSESDNSPTIPVYFPWFYGATSVEKLTLTPTEILAGTRIIGSSKNTIKANWNMDTPAFAWFAIPTSNFSSGNQTKSGWSVNPTNQDLEGIHNDPTKRTSKQLFCVVDGLVTVSINNVAQSYRVYTATYKTDLPSVDLLPSV